jgi:hypothetical protein
MRKRILAAACTAGALSALLWTGEAKADVTGYSWGHATLNGGPRFASEDLDFGLGLNVGYTLDMGLYLGGLVDHFFAEEFVDLTFFMFDIGFDIGFGDKFVLRPTGSLGLANFWLDCDRCEDDTEGRFAFAMGANALYAIDQLLIGGELRYWWIDDADDGIWAGFNIGVVF